MRSSLNVKMELFLFLARTATAATPAFMPTLVLEFAKLVFVLEYLLNFFELNQARQR